MGRRGMSEKMVWIIIIVIIVLVGGGIIAFLMLRTGQNLPFCDWWSFFTENVLGDLQILRNLFDVGTGCPFPE